MRSGTSLKKEILHFPIVGCFLLPLGKFLKRVALKTLDPCHKCWTNVVSEMLLHFDEKTISRCRSFVLVKSTSKNSKTFKKCSLGQDLTLKGLEGGSIWTPNHFLIFLRMYFLGRIPASFYDEFRDYHQQNFSWKFHWNFFWKDMTLFSNYYFLNFLTFLGYQETNGIWI